MYCHSGRGPCFSGGLYVQSARSSVTADYDRGSLCDIGNCYEDVLGRGQASLTGEKHFLPDEVEVFAVMHA